MPAISRGFCLLFLELNILLLLVLLLGSHSTKAYSLPEAEQYAEQLAQQRLFAGMLHVDQGGSTVLSRGFGLSSYELDAPMRNDHRYPIGSNTKLFTAVALWQLHRASKLSVYDDVAQHLTNHTELGLKGTWCPRVYGTPDQGPCQQVQIQQLLRMSGGVIGFDNCAYSPGAWQRQYCMGGPKGANFSFDDYQAMQLGAASIADYLRLTGVLGLPLEFQPGSSYHYSNPGYSIAGYIVEKVSGMPLADYFRINFFEKYGLSSTLYDPSNGVVGLHKRQLPYPAYITYLQPGQDAAIANISGSTTAQLAASTGDPRAWGGDVRGAGSSDKAGTATRSAQQQSVSVGMTAKYPGATGSDWTLANAAGAIVSSPQDMAKWFRALMVDPAHLGLGKELLREMLTLSTDVPGVPVMVVSDSSSSNASRNATLAFAQGLLVVKDSQHPRGLGVSNVYYLGSLGGFQAVVYMWLHPTEPSKDVFVNSVAATVLPDSKDWSAAAQNLSGSCLEQPGTHPLGRRAMPKPARTVDAASGGQGSVDVSGVLCELLNMSPSVIKTLPDLLARKAFRSLTGHEWFGIQAS